MTTNGAVKSFDPRTFVVLVALLGLAGCSHLKMGLFMLNRNPGENDPSSVARGSRSFHENCTRCHGENGAGPDAVSLSTVPTNFRDPTYSKAAIRIAAHIAYGKGSDMPAFDGILPYETIWDIANYLRSQQKQ